MKTFKKALLGLGLALGALAALGAGCARHDAGQSAEQASGPAMPQGGAAQGDYARIRNLGHSVGRTHTISDADLDWTLGLLHGAGNPIARARPLTILSEIRPMSAGQKAKIAPAVAPYLNSSDPLDKAGAQKVQQAMQTAAS